MISENEPIENIIKMNRDNANKTEFLDPEFITDKFDIKLDEANIDFLIENLNDIKHRIKQVIKNTEITLIIRKSSFRLLFRRTSI